MKEETHIETVKIKELLRGACVGELVKIKGWISNRKSLGGIVFLKVRDGTGTIQCVVNRENTGPVVETADSLLRETAVELTGRTRKDNRASHGQELEVITLDVLAKADTKYPLGKYVSGRDVTLKNRHLSVRDEKCGSILRIRAKVSQYITNFLDERGYLRVDAPILTQMGSEGKGNLFIATARYITEQTAVFLSQSGQLYNEALAMALGRVYSFGPAFRAENYSTTVHLSEFWMVEPEAVFVDYHENVRLQETLITHICHNLLEYDHEDLIVLNADTTSLEAVTPPFPRLTYQEATDKLKASGIRFEYGDIIGRDEEKALTRDLQIPLILHRYPRELKPFYAASAPDDPTVVLYDDIIAPSGYGELIGGSERISDHQVLLSRMMENKLPLKPYQWYLDLRRFGSVQHSGFGLGLERLVSWVCGLDNIQDAIPFPRLLNRLSP